MAADTSPVYTDKGQLINYMASGCKPESAWRIGTEHEKFAYRLSDLTSLPYEGDHGIRALLEGMQRFNWNPVIEDGNVIALTMPDGCSITLEPAGQVELSGAMLENIHQTCTEVGTHLKQVKEVACEMGIGFLGLGYQPKWPMEDLPWMPKGRYQIMRDYMPKKGDLGLHMMKSTCTVQVNLDFDSEETMRQMFQIALAIQPIATALFANSPFRDGKPTGYLSYRSHIWTDTDPDRTGMLPFVFDKDFGFERYVDYMLDVPMYFVYRDGVYHDVAGKSFRDFLAGKLDGFEGQHPTEKDWEDHLTTAFPEVRLKKFLEMRGADGGPWNRLCALPALWVGLLYDKQARADAHALISGWSVEDISAARDGVPKTALKTPFQGKPLSETALDVLEIAHDGLKRRNKLDWVGLDETHFLNPLFRIAESGFTPAEELLSAYERRWNKSVDPVFQEYAY